jgi:tRNA pseudouridine55 synthase
VANDLHGYLNVLKPPDWTSHDVVAKLRRLTGQRRIGHAGTLDPAAIGVLPVALGRATRTTSSTAWDRKLYRGDVTFGTATDTDDATGRAVATGSTAHLDPDRCIAALWALVGDIQQRPPAYSAVHVDGRRAYAEARRGKSGELAPRPVRIDAISLCRWRPPTISLLIQCRSGTYIRSLARDLGAALKCPAHLSALARLRVGSFDIKEAIGLDVWAELADADAWDRVLWPTDVAALDNDVIIVSSERTADFVHGRAWIAPGQVASQSDISHGEGTSVRVYAENGGFIGLAERAESLTPTRPSLSRSACSMVSIAATGT